MWLVFVLAVLACIAFLYAPGFLFCRGVGLAGLTSLVSAPLVSIVLYCAIGAGYSACAVPCTWLSVFPLACALCAVPFALRYVRGRWNTPASEHVAWGSLCAYLVMGIVVSSWMFVGTLDTPQSFVQTFDNAFHLNVIRAFDDSGAWSFLHAGKYLTSDDAAISPLGGAGFYPAAWHVVCVLVMNALGCPLTLAVNAVAFVTVAIVFPLGMLGFMTGICTSRRIVFLGAFCVLAFVGYPWAILIWGTLYPNVLACALAPAAMMLFVRIVDRACAGELALPHVVVFAFALVALAISQPNALFLCIVILTPYCVYRIWTLDHDVTILGHVVPRRLLAVLFAVLVVAIWTALVFSPFMHASVFEENWAATMGKGQAVMNVLTLCFTLYDPQPLLAVLVLVGTVCCLLHREHLWVVVGYLVFCLMYVLCVSTEGFPKHFFAGFWYTDSYRIVACLSIAAIPLVALGLDAIARLVDALLGRGRGHVRRIACGVLLAVFCVLAYMPSIHIRDTTILTALGEVHDGLVSNNSRKTKSLLEADERAFVEQVKEIVPEGELVVNVPDDGSIYAYGVSGLRVLYRDFRVYDDGSSAPGSSGSVELPASKLIRKGASGYLADERVRAALDEVGARYFLILDEGDSLAEGPPVGMLDEDLWTGITSIAPDTPGFELVLSEGDMRLYELEDREGPGFGDRDALGAD